MRPPFTDESRLLSRARALTENGLGRLQLWHLGRHKPYQGVGFDDRTPGDLLEEFYFTVATEQDEMAGRRSSLTAGEKKRLVVLDGILHPDRAEFDDDLSAYWEYRIAKGLSVDLDIQVAPPRLQWDISADTEGKENG